MKRSGVNSKDAYKISHAAKPFLKTQALKPGLLVETYLTNDSNKPHEVIIRDRFDHHIKITPDANKYKAIGQPINQTPIYDYVEGTITSSLYEASRKAGLPSKVFAQMVKLFSYDVDFQRDIRAGTEFQIYYERNIAESYEDITDGPILFAKLTLYNRSVEIGRYTDKNQVHDYYTPEGRSIRKALMKTPVDGARLSGRFGKRKHPVLGYTKKHNGALRYRKVGVMYPRWRLGARWPWALGFNRFAV